MDSVEEREEKLLTKRSNQHWDDMDDNQHAWRLWSRPRTVFPMSAHQGSIRLNFHISEQPPCMARFLVIPA